MAAKPRDLKARRVAFEQASGYTDTRVGDVHRALSSLEDYAHEVVGHGETCDPGKLRALTQAALNATEELESIAYLLNDAADERTRWARETLAAGDDAIVLDAPTGGYVKALRISSQTDDGRWQVEGSRTAAPDFGWHQHAVTDFDLAKALRYACGFYDRSPACDALAEEIITGLLS